MTLNGLKAFFSDVGAAMAILDSRGLLKWIPDSVYLKILYRIRLKKKLDLKNPKTFNEKLQWLKLYNRKPEYTQMVDKYEAKQYVAECIGEEYVVPCYGVWNSFDEIPFDELPNQFVLKCTHDSGGLVICRDKDRLDKEAAKQKLESCQKRNYYYGSREWPYKNVKPRIIAEKYLEDTVEDALTDYKFFCFNGEAKIMYISKDKGKNPKTDFFDMQFMHLPIQARDPNADVQPQRPVQFDEMRRIAEILSQGIPHLRVDFYIVDQKIYIGEMTFFHMSGLVSITPAEWNEKMGSWISVPEKKIC